MPPLYLTQRSCNTNRQDGLPKGAPSWGDELAEWIQVETDPGFIEPPSDWRLRGFILKGFHKANNLYEWVAAALHEDTTGQEANVDITLDLLIPGMTIEGLEWSLEYYEERVEQGGSQLEFQDIESLPGDTLPLLRVEEAAGYLPTPPQKKKCHSHFKTMDTDKEDLYSSFGKDSLGSDDSGPP
ncbi:hypothetical protein SCLCIDRAFT_31223 [Scleroderma citrinum Foug A]|uniref:Uncharacterized protein n=1 Tax=Scleroderma citrinum Foug A TaxID=1036808 RepID=A0A0C2YXF5_9AGAM|nr:hypothetical protein SCLCIDRAFT_31223 [Scleroderma citrinum Foug A]